MNVDAVLAAFKPAAPVVPCPWSEQTKGKPKWVHCCDGYGKASDTGTWARCGSHWRNTEALNHCPTCHGTFTSLAAFDAHRAGPHGGTRACLTVTQMADDDWTITPGVDGLADTWTAPAKGSK